MTDVKCYTPPIRLEELDVAPGEWLILNSESLVALSGKRAQSVIEEARRQKLDLSESPIRQAPMAADDEEAFFDD